MADVLAFLSSVFFFFIFFLVLFLLLFYRPVSSVWVRLFLEFSLVCLLSEILIHMRQKIQFHVGTYCSSTIRNTYVRYRHAMRACMCEYVLCGDLNVQLNSLFTTFINSWVSCFFHIIIRHNNENSSSRRGINRSSSRSNSSRSKERKK